MKSPPGIEPAATPATVPRSSPGYETTDVRVRTLLGFGLAIVLQILAAFGGLWLLWQSYQGTARNDGAGTTRLSRIDQVPPLPRLQSSPTADYNAFLADQIRSLSGYEWVDREHGIVQIPIEHAITLAVERGLPQPKPVPSPTENSTPKATEQQP